MIADLSLTQKLETDYAAAPLETLVEAAQAGDRDAFGELATPVRAMVYAIALRRLGNHSEAQELCQEVLVKAMQKLEQLEVPAAFGGWLRSITVRMAINRQVRRAPLIATEPQTLEATCVESSTPLDAALAQRAGGASPRRPRAARRARSEHARSVLRPRRVAGRDEPVVRSADRHDQAPAARRAEAAGSAPRCGCRMTTTAAASGQRPPRRRPGRRTF